MSESNMFFDEENQTLTDLGKIIFTPVAYEIIDQAVSEGVTTREGMNSYIDQQEAAYQASDEAMEDDPEPPGMRAYVLEIWDERQESAA